MPSFFRPTRTAALIVAAATTASHAEPQTAPIPVTSSVLVGTRGDPVVARVVSEAAADDPSPAASPVAAPADRISARAAVPSRPLCSIPEALAGVAIAACVMKGTCGSTPYPSTGSPFPTPIAARLAESTSPRASCDLIRGKL